MYNVIINKMKGSIMKFLLISLLFFTALFADVLISVDYAQSQLNSSKSMLDLYNKSRTSYVTQMNKYIQMRDSATNQAVKDAYQKSVDSHVKMIDIYDGLIKTSQAKYDKALINYNNTYAYYNPVVEPEIIKIITPDLKSVDYLSAKRAYDMIGVNDAWLQGYTGKGITIAVVDSGISTTNTDVNKFYSNIIDFGLLFKAGDVYNSTKTVLGVGNISNINVTSSSTSKLYTKPPTVQIIGNGTGAKAQVRLDANGKIIAIQMTDFGVNYSGNVQVVLKDEFGNIDSSYTVTPMIAGVDYNGHGTGTASLIAGTYDGKNTLGIAYNANIIPVKIGDGTISTTDGLDGARLAVLKGATIINQSYESVYISPALIQGYQDLMKTGVAVVQAAGNKGLDCLTTSNCNALATIPLTYNQSSVPGAFIVVGALNYDGTDIASFSNKAGITKDYYILAPGSSVPVASLVDGVKNSSGTSFSAPIVSGTMALLKEKWPRLSSNQQAQILFSTADDMGANGVDEIYGHGKLNVSRAFSPVGDLKATTGVSNVAGLDKIIPLSNVTTSITGNALIYAKLSSYESLKDVVAFDGFNRDYNLDMTKYMSFDKETFSFNQFLNFSIGDYVVGINNQYNAPYIGMKTKYGQIGYSYVDGFYGSQGTGVLGFNGSTHYFNYQYNKTANELSYAFGLNVGYADAKNTQGSMIKNTDSVAVGASAKVLYKNFGLLGYIPAKIISGSTTTTTAVSSDIDGNIQYASNEYQLSEGSFERTYGVVYENQGLSIELSKTDNTYGIGSLDSTNLKVRGAWYF